MWTRCKNCIEARPLAVSNLFNLCSPQRGHIRGLISDGLVVCSAMHRKGASGLVVAMYQVAQVVRTAEPCRAQGTVWTGASIFRVAVMIMVVLFAMADHPDFRLATLCGGSILHSSGTLPRVIFQLDRAWPILATGGIFMAYVAHLDLERQRMKVPDEIIKAGVVWHRRKRHATGA